MNTPESDPLTPFDEACEEFEVWAAEHAAIEALPAVGLLRRTLDALSAVVPFGASGVSARETVKRIHDTYKVMKASRPFIKENEVDRYRNAVKQLLRELTLAAEAALKDSSGFYAISAQLRAAANTLSEAYKRVKANAAAMSTVADAMNGAATLIKALG